MSYRELVKAAGSVLEAERVLPAYRVVYLWGGERYWYSRDFASREEAADVVRELRHDGWPAWIERG